jgi:hypothetical protein
MPAAAVKVTVMNDSTGADRRVRTFGYLAMPNEDPDVVRKHLRSGAAEFEFVAEEEP